jgi:large subunit ribosomal protein L1
MPNPTGTVNGCCKAAAEVKAGKIDFKVDKTGVLRIGKVSFELSKLLTMQ